MISNCKFTNMFLITQLNSKKTSTKKYLQSLHRRLDDD